MNEMNINNEDQRYVIICGKNRYRLVGSLFIIVILVTAFIINHLNEIHASVFLDLSFTAIACYFFWHAIYFITRDVYATIYFDSLSLVYGNEFIQEKCKLTEVEIIGKSTIFPAMIVLIKGKQHRVFLNRDITIDQIRDILKYAQKK